MVFALRGADGRRLLDGWLSWARRCQTPAFVELARTVAKHRPGIEATLAHGLSNARVEAAIVSWALSQALGEVLRQGQRARTKAHMRFLIGEIRVVSPDDIRPTYRVPAAVRIPEELVAEGGFEPPTKGL